MAFVVRQMERRREAGSVECGALGMGMGTRGQCFGAEVIPLSAVKYRLLRIVSNYANEHTIMHFLIDSRFDLEY